MRTFTIGLLLAIASATILAGSSQAWTGRGPGWFLLTPPNPADGALAELVVVGRGNANAGWRVRAIGEWLGDKKERDYLMFEIDVLDVLKGPKNLKKLTIGIIDNIEVNGRSLDVSKQLSSGKTALLFVEKNEWMKCYLAPQHYHVVSTNRPDYDGFVAETRAEIARWGDKKMKIMKDPQVGLRAKSFDERMFAARLLITRYRTPVGKPPYETEPIDAEESRLILSTLAEAKWSYEKEHFNLNSKSDREVCSHRHLFNMLELPGWTGKEKLYLSPFGNIPPPYSPSGYGFVPPRPFPEQWLVGNADTYRIRRYVPPAEKTSGKKD